ncbi:D-glycero-alpha-D-manno-heptose 1-phosphate guanylyltransferase [Curtobacterium sp. 320]|uniref:sugar phosphate nucleotidyltransferase n=1 Tax=Curtobacterium sp. 320 TaxID=2817749 RepID=UPI00285CE734|nr:sugar phosphate nucleotidyltransferase [Curtobacterium sp. 320]MDR6573151.1 D-glycero-alpha-D-manno-heptose 1-phosphate guanylyltransferase [Curtobacterium sp. 320]
MQVVVLAGGLGTRLRGAVPDGTPKPMAPVAGRPFLEWLLEDCARAGATEFVLLVGHHAAVIRDHFGSAFAGVPVRYSTETSPRGTGGAVRDALPLLRDRFVVMNGDTYGAAELPTLLAALDGADFAMTLATVPDVGRFGGVDTDGARVVALREKGSTGRGRINAGVYGMRKRFVETFPTDPFVSFERDVMEVRIPELRPPFVVGGATFFDIGVPDDLRAADTWFRER